MNNRAGSHNGPHGLSRFTLVYCGRATLSLRRNRPKRRDRRSANPEQHDALRSAEMLCAIIVKPGYLKVDLFNQQTAAETRDALGTIAAEARKRKSSQILISVHASRPIFKVEQYGLPDYFRELGEVSKCRIALTGDSDELRLSQQYSQVLGRRN